VNLARAMSAWGPHKGSNNLCFKGGAPTGGRGFRPHFGLSGGTPRGALSGVVVHTQFPDGLNCYCCTPPGGGVWTVLCSPPTEGWGPQPGPWAFLTFFGKPTLFSGREPGLGPQTLEATRAPRCGKWTGGTILPGAFAGAGRGLTRRIVGPHHNRFFSKGAENRLGPFLPRGGVGSPNSWAGLPWWG